MVDADADPFDSPDESSLGGDRPFLVDIDGFEGPLDLLLELAKRQKLDLQKISILALADQYLAFIEAGRRLRLELAADYLVMAAYLAYLKSRLLLPEPPKDEPPAADLAAEFARRLKQLEAIRGAAKLLVDRPRLDRDFFARGSFEPVEGRKTVVWEATLYDLLSAYAQRRRQQAGARVSMARRLVWSLAQAREVLLLLLGQAVDWMRLDDYLMEYLTIPENRRTVRASTFSATLEMVREGHLSIRQEQAFGAIWLKAPGAVPQDLQGS
jgi:segregation and condensation protein A